MQPSHLLLDCVLLAMTTFTVGSNTLRVIKTRSVKGLALPTILYGFCGTLTWIVYGMGQHNDTQVLLNAMCALSFMIILFAARQLGEIRGRKIAGISIAYAGLAATITYIAGMEGLGIVVSALTFFVRLPQIMKAWTEPGGDGISVAGQSGDATQCGLWFVSGLIIGDFFLVITSVYGMAASLFVVARTVATRRTPAEEIELDEVQLVA